MSRPIMEELSLEPHTGDLSSVAGVLDNLDMKKVKTNQ